MQVLDARICELGEGPLWHPLQQRWYWFDILNSRLLGQDDAGEYFGNLTKWYRQQAGSIKPI